MAHPTCAAVFALSALALGTASAAGAPLQATDKLTAPAGSASGFGSAAAAVGDFNGDGKGDFSVWRDQGATPAAAAAASYITFGSADPADFRSPAAGGKAVRIAINGTGNDWVRPAGDVDGDGKDDVLIANAGRSYIVFGAAGTAPVSLDPAGNARVMGIVNNFKGYAPNLNPIGDFDGDGFDDLIMERSADAVIVRGGPRLPSIDAQSTGPRLIVFSPITRCGWTSTIIPYYKCTTALKLPQAIGDVNGDGREDLFLPDRSFISLGRPGTATISGAGPDAKSINFPGAAIATETAVPLRPGRYGDLTGDGIDDMVLYGFYTGKLQIVPGRRIASGTITASTVPSVVITVPGGADEIQPAGDQNGDGRQDLAIRQRLAIRILSVSATVPSATTDAGTAVLGYPTEDVYSGFGNPVATPAGDLDGDGQPDMVLGGPFDEEGRPNGGGVFLLTHGLDRAAPALAPRGLTTPEVASSVTPALFSAGAAPAGTTIRINLLEPADVILTYRRASTGAVLGTERVAGLPGGVTNRPWDGQGRGIDGAPGDYLLDLQPVDAAGNVGLKQTVPFTIRGGVSTTPPTMTVTRTSVVPPTTTVQPFENPPEQPVEGTCPEAAYLLAGATPKPLPLTGAHEGDACRLTYVGPHASDGYGHPAIPSGVANYPWRTTVSVNGAAPIDIAAGDYVVATIPPFALRPGANTIVIKDTWDDRSLVRPLTPVIPTWTFPQPASGATTVNSAVFVPGTRDVQLTTAGAGQIGLAVACPAGLDPSSMVVEFDAVLDGGGTGGQSGLTFNVMDAAPAAMRTTNGNVGLGWVGYTGTAFALVTQKGTYNTSDNFIGMASGVIGKSGYPSWLATSVPGKTLAGATTHVKVATANGRATLAIDGVTRIDEARVLPSHGCVGLSAATGLRYQRHLIKNLTIGQR